MFTKCNHNLKINVKSVITAGSMSTCKVITFSGILCMLYIYSASGFNIETRNPVVKRGEINTYFGYSVALHKSEDNGNISSSWWG